MTSENWDLVAKIFDAALAQPKDARHDFVQRECRGQEELEAEILRLLAADERADSFLERSPLTTIPPRTAAGLNNTLPVGSIVSGRFEILRLIGQGGMGQVYEALDLELRTRVALKTIRPDVSSDPQMLSRFRREVQFTRRITHPNVCRTFDIERHCSAASDGTGSDITFLTMELLEGETLADVLRRKGRFNAVEAAPLVFQMIEALGAAHAAGIVHRDFKPSNVLIVPSSNTLHPELRVVVTDFGLARALRPPESSQLSIQAATSLAVTQGLMGTLVYMAPEQFERGEATVASDVYSLGLVMYEMVTGQRPFADLVPFAEAAKRLKQSAPSAKLLVPELDSRWVETICRCLESKADDRFGSVLEVAIGIRGSDAGTRAAALPPLSDSNPSLWTLSGALIHQRTGSRLNRRVILALAVLLVSLFVMSSRHYMRRPRAVQFTERDWILVTDFTNQTGEHMFDRVLRNLVVQSLSQSSYVNIVPRPDALQAAKHSGFRDITTIDEKLGNVLCLRENYRALLVGGIVKNGSDYTIAMKIEIPGNAPAISSSETFQSPDELFASVDRLTARLRHDLGESPSRVEANTKPLAQVTTTSLEALQRYSAAVDLFNIREFQRSINLGNDAIDRDPNFAMAHLLLARAYEQMANETQSQKEFEEARAHLDRASEREKHLILAAAYASNLQNDKAAQEYQHLLDIYPDDIEALRQFAIAIFYAGHPERAIAAQKKALALSQNDPGSYDYLMELLVRTNQFSEALGVYDQAQERHLPTTGFRFLAALAAWGNGDLKKAEQYLTGNDGESNDYTEIVNRLYLGKLLAFQGRLLAAETVFRGGLGLSRHPGFEDWAIAFQYQLLSIELIRGNMSGARLEVHKFAELAKHAPTAGNLERAGNLSIRVGDIRSAQSFLHLIDAKVKEHDDPFSEMEFHTLSGEIASAKGRKKDAIQEEQTALDIQEGYEPLLALAHTCEQNRAWDCSIDAYKRYLLMKGAVLRYDVASDWVIAQYRLARVYADAGDKASAIKYGQRFLDMLTASDPGLLVAGQAKRELNQWNDSNHHSIRQNN